MSGTGGMPWFQESPGTSHGRRPRDAYEYSPLGDAGAEIKRGAEIQEEEDVKGLEKNVSQHFLGAVVGRVVQSPVTVVYSRPTPSPAVGMALNLPSYSLSTSQPTGISLKYPSTPLHVFPQPLQGSSGGVDAGDETVTGGLQKASPVYPSPPPLRDAAMAVRDRERAREREREVQRAKEREASETKPDEQRRSPSFPPLTPSFPLQTSSCDKGRQLFEAEKEAEGVCASADGEWRVCVNGTEDVFTLQREGIADSLLGYGTGRGRRNISPLSTSLGIASPSSTTTLRIASPSYEVMAPTTSENRLLQPSSMSPPSRLSSLLSSLQQTGRMHPPPHHEVNASSILTGSAAREPRNVFGDAVGGEATRIVAESASQGAVGAAMAQREEHLRAALLLDDAGSAENGGAHTGVETLVLSQDTPCGVSAADVQARLSPSPSLHPSSHVALGKMQAQKTCLQDAIREADAILSTPSPKAGSGAGGGEKERQREERQTEVKPASSSTAQVQVARQMTKDREFEFVTSVHAAMGSLFLEV